MEVTFDLTITIGGVKDAQEAYDRLCRLLDVPQLEYNTNTFEDDRGIADTTVLMPDFKGIKES